MNKKVICLAVSGLMALVLLAAACTSAPAKKTTPVAPAAQEASAIGVEISGFAFVPATVTVAVGTTVTWSNKDSTMHSVSSQGTLFDSGRLSRGTTFSYTFNQKGTFEYRCAIHPSMKAKVVVE